MADPHRGQGRILALLKLKPEISQKELSSILDIRSQSLGELLAKLERSGYITRSQSKADRRVMDICLTDAGKEAANQDEQQPDNDKLFGCLSEEEQDTLSDYFKRITDDLDKQFGDDESDLYGSAPYGRIPFNGRGFDPRFNVHGGWPDFGGGSYGGHSNMSRNPDDPDKK
jgi:DNA-binding MarR family transcriptional regulator